MGDCFFRWTTHLPLRGKIGDGLYILVVDDDPVLNGLICGFLRLAGFASRSAFDGAAALRIAREQPPLLVLLDVMLPDHSGFEVCEELRQDNRTCNVPTLMVTAMHDEESRRQGAQSGACGYVLKPFDPDALIGTLKRHLVRQTAQAAAL